MLSADTITELLEWRPTRRQIDLLDAVGHFKHQAFLELYRQRLDEAGL